MEAKALARVNGVPIVLNRLFGARPLYRDGALLLRLWDPESEKEHSTHIM